MGLPVDALDVLDRVAEEPKAPAPPNEFIGRPMGRTLSPFARRVDWPISPSESGPEPTHRVWFGPGPLRFGVGSDPCGEPD